MNKIYQLQQIQTKKDYNLIRLSTLFHFYMGSQCSNLYDKIIGQDLSRNTIMQFISTTAFNQKDHSIDMNIELNQKIDLIKNISKQIIKQNSSDIQSFQKYPQNKFIVKFTNGSQYKGVINQKGMRDKQGQQKWPDNTRYMGNWKNNQPHGQGVLISPNGFTFQGKWNQGLVQGYGKYYGRSGSFEGDWEANHPHGFGIQTWDDGSKYEGYFLQGKKHGKGTYVWPDHSSYKGQWYQGRIYGQGVYNYQDGRIYKGTFVDNKMHGQGTYVWPDGRKYIGQYSNDKKEGQGRYYWPDERYYQGEWRDGKRNGYGKIVFKNGVIKYGIWDNDQKIEETQVVEDKIKSHIQTALVKTFPQSQYEQPCSPKFNYKNSRVTEATKSAYRSSSMHRKSLSLPKTQYIPLYASSASPYNHLKQYYNQYTNESKSMKQRVSNRYKFINSPLKIFNEGQLTGQNSKYLHNMQRQKQRLSLFEQQRNRKQIQDKNDQFKGQNEILRYSTMTGELKIEQRRHYRRKRTQSNQHSGSKSYLQMYIKSEGIQKQ